MVIFRVRIQAPESCDANHRPKAPQHADSPVVTAALNRPTLLNQDVSSHAERSLEQTRTIREAELRVQTQVHRATRPKKAPHPRRTHAPLKSD